MSSLKPTHSIQVRAFAKINLGLSVFGKRADGYHEIHTIYQTVALHDRLEIQLQTRRGAGSRAANAGDIRVVCDDPTVPSGPQNLVYRACSLWKRARAFRGQVAVRLEKRIPAGSGLGGGSSDAGATLLALEHLTGERLDQAARLRLAARLGSDVPLFLHGGRVLGCGRGDEVHALDDLPRRRCLVVFPGFPVSTAEAYKALRRRQTLGLTRTVRPPSISSFGARPQFPLADWEPAENDFEHVVFAKWPELARLKRRLIRAGAEVASLTGSGSAVYAIFASAPQLLCASRLVPAGWQVFRTRTLSRAEYRRLLFRE